MDDAVSRDLDSWLNQAKDRYVVDRTLKSSPSEETQVVYRQGADGRAAAGPFVRKIFFDQSIGLAYAQLFDAQAKGTHLDHLPLIYDCDQTATTLEVVMEYVQGETLESYVRRTGAGQGIAVLACTQLCDALTALHENMSPPIIHRDVKPSNVMIASNRVTLIDLGIARAYRSGAEHDTMRYGTPGYAPPEQFGYGQTSARSDLYSLGMTLSFCLTGEEPTQQLRESGFLDGRIPPAMREVLVKATQFDPALRYASARELKEGLVRAAEGHPRPVADPSRPQQQEPGTDSRRKGPPALLGKIWNAVVIVVWAVLLLALSRGIFNPVDSLKDAPRWLLVVMYLGAFAIPFTAVGYLLLDKRRLRAREPFSRHTWKQELPFCLGVAAVSFLIALLVAAFGYPRP